MSTRHSATSSQPPHPPLLLNRSDVYALLDLPSCIAAIGAAFQQEADGSVIPAGVLGTHVEHGGFHVKTAGTLGETEFFAAKINANFPSNRERFGLPTIQGVLALFDANRGSLLAVMDSMSVTAIRTAAATAVAAKHLARRDATSALMVGCGVQGRSQLRALCSVRTVRRVMASDTNDAALARFVSEMTQELGVEVAPVKDSRASARDADIVVACTTSLTPLFDAGDIPAGTFV